MLDLTRLARFALVGSLIAVAGGSASGVAAQTIPPDLYSGLTWRCVGPFDGGPVASVTGIPGEAGIYVITTPSGGTWKTIDGGETWQSIDRQGGAVAAVDPHRWIDPSNPRRVVRTDDRGIEVSLDAGQTWVASHHLPIAEITRIVPREHQPEPAIARRSIAGKPANVVVADPARAGLLFAGTNDSVYVSFDAGAHWESLGLNLPSVAINDLDIRGNDLVAATQGRSVWQLDDISPLRQLSAAATSAAAILFKPADATLITQDPKVDSFPTGANVDYYLRSPSTGEVKLEILDPGGRVIHAATSVTPQSTDRWLPVTRPLSAAPGHHRVAWNLRVDPPPAMKHQYAQMARTLFEDTPADPDGPRVLAGTYRVRLTVGARVYSQPLVVQHDTRVPDTPATRLAERQQFDLAMKMYDAMELAHRGFMQLTRVRAQLRPMLTSPDAQVALAAADLDKILADLDGSAWTGLVIPDADDEAGEVDEKEGKHPDFVPPKPVSISKDYDDPTSILGRSFANVDHAPAFATVSAALGGMLTKTADAAAAPDEVAVADYARSCQQLAGVLDAWRAINAQDLPRVNAELARRKLPPLPITTRVSSIACGSKAP